MFHTRALFGVTLISFALCHTFSLHAVSAADKTMKAGFAERDISPDIGMEAPGGYGKAYHKVFHDACKVRAAVFDDGEQVAAVVGLDALFIREQTVKKVRQRILDKTGIPSASVLIAASHTHAGGPVGFYLPSEFDQADPFVKSLVNDHTVIAHPQYLEKVENALVEAVTDAFAHRVEARCAAAYGHEEHAGFNRRFRMQSGLSATHPGVGNPDILEPAGPIDPHVGVIGAWDMTGKPLGCVVNFACHATTGPGGISADWIYYMERTIQGLFGPEMKVVYLPGMGGDITQVDNRTPYEIRQFGEVSGRKVGGRVGAEAAKVLTDLEQAGGRMSPIVGKSKVLQIARRAPRAEKVAAALETVKKDPQTVDATLWTFCKETVVLDARIKFSPVAEVEVQALQIGPVVFLTSPAEYFCQFGLDMRAASPFPLTFPVSLANGCVGYVPTEEALGPRGGGYETRLTSYSNLIPTAGTKIAETSIELAKSLTPGVVPVSPPHPEFKKAVWSYGNLGPELD